MGPFENNGGFHETETLSGPSAVNVNFSGADSGAEIQNINSAGRLNLDSKLISFIFTEEMNTKCFFLCVLNHEIQ